MPELPDRASIVTIAAPDIAIIIQCWRCQSVAVPSLAEYWHIGAMAIRLAKVSPPISIGEKRREVMGWS